MRREEWRNWRKFLKDNKFDEVLVVANAMQEKGSLSEKEIADLLVPEEQCSLQDKVDYILNIMRSMRLTDDTLSWRGN